MNRRLVSLLASLIALMTAGCLGSLPHERVADHLVSVAADPMALPVRESLPHWMLRSAPGWQGAHTSSLGGSEQDGAAVIVRVALFTDATAARDAFATMTPARLYHLRRHTMAGEPLPVPDPPALIGDEVKALQYAVRGSSHAPAPAPPVEMVLVRAGRAVLVVDYIGLPPARLEAAVAAFVAGAAGQ